ncbi:MAG: alginate lyase family protein [Bacteroidota bacterium]
MHYKFILVSFLLLISSCNSIENSTTDEKQQEYTALEDQEQASLIALANQYLKQAAVPITKFKSERSAGGLHDFYSEGDYWWPNPDDSDGPYIRKDGQSNPDNFTAHRKAMRELNIWVGTLVAAYKVTGNPKYATHALQHLRAFFLDPETLMNPNLLYAQAIKGRVTGRGIGIIDTIHLIEIARAIKYLSAGFLSEEDEAGLKKWFEDYATWMNTHEYGLDEKDHGNNHSTWWAAQMAAFADLTGRDDLMEVARQQFKKLLPEQMAADGSFPDELSRTKPYNYSLFNLEAYAVLCQLAATPTDNLWEYESEKGSFQKAWTFMVPYMQDKSTWIKAPDVQHFEELPIQSPGLLFAALAYQNEDFLQTWKALSPERQSEEIKRTFPIYQPILWVDRLDFLR